MHCVSATVLKPHHAVWRSRGCGGQQQVSARGCVVLASSGFFWGLWAVQAAELSQRRGSCLPSQAPWALRWLRWQAA